MSQSAKPYILGNQRYGIMYITIPQGHGIEGYHNVRLNP